MKLNPLFRYCSSPLITLKVWPIRTAVVCLLIGMTGNAAVGQEQPPVTEPNYEFVSGTVAELPAGKIVVNRALLGKPAGIFGTFLITGETKRLKANSGPKLVSP